MVRRWKLVWLGAFAALAALAGGYAYSRAHAAPSYRLANGVEVTPLDVPPDDVSKLLDIRMYKFDVVQTGTPKPLYVSLVQCRNGVLVQTLVGGFVLLNPVKRMHVTFGLSPIGDTFFGAKQLKYYTSEDSTGSTGTIPNILLGGHGYTSSTQAVGNLVVLMSTNKNKTTVTSDVTSNDTGLALNFSRTSPTQ